MQTTLAAPPASFAFAPGRRPMVAAAGLLLALALLLRSAWFGNPLAGYDEQFYLLTGARMWDGAIPYVDVWDRKPIGLFLIYALAARFGDGILAYQLLATGCVAATALVIVAMVRRRLPFAAALGCGTLYTLWVGVMGGENGQSPLFYNLPVALAALLLFDAIPRIATPPGQRRAAGAMLLCGVALTVKTTVIFEACFFGLAAVAALLHSRTPPARAAAITLGWMALGALPFGLAALWYAAHGHLDAFWFANAASAALRHEGWTWHTLWALCLTLAPLLPLALLAVAGLRHAGEGNPTPGWERHFLLGWIVAATLGFSAVGYFYHHYALPLLVPLVLAGGRFLAFSPHRRLALALFAFYPAVQQVAINRLLAADDRADAVAATAAIPDRVRSECMLLYGGPPILYHLSGACLASPYGFPGHLYLSAETPAIGQPQIEALAAALARRPAVIVTERDPSELKRNPAADALIARRLANGYRLRATSGYRYFEESRHTLLIWERRGDR